MSKKLLAIYITSSILLVTTLIAIGIISKIIFGGLNINLIEKRFSSYLNNEYGINFESDNFTLMYNDEFGIFIDIKNTNIFLNDETSLTASEISVDLNLLDIVFSDLDQIIKVYINEVNIIVNNINKEILLKGNIIEIQTDSFLDISNPRVLVSSSLITGDDTFSEKFYFSFNYDFKNQELNILDFYYGDIFISEPSFVKYSSEKQLWEVDLNIKAKKEPLTALINIADNEEIKKIISGFVGWQSISLISNFNFEKKSFLAGFIENMNINLSGIYELDRILPKNQFYKNFGNITSYTLELSKPNNKFNINIENFKNDKVTLKKGSHISINDNFQNSNVNLITTVGKNTIIDYIKTSISTREGNANKAIKFFEENLNKENDLVLNFSFNPLSNDINSSIKNLSIKSQGMINSNFIFDDNENPNYSSGYISYDILVDKFLSDSPSIKGEFDLTNINAFIRQINFNKKDREILKINFNSNIQDNSDSVISFKSFDSKIEIDGNIRITETNHLFLDSFSLNNGQNVKIKILGDLSERILNLSIFGKIIDLSMNKVVSNRKIKNHYLFRENYKINTDQAIFSGGAKVNNFEAEIIKEGNILSVDSRANVNDHTLEYSREKNNKVDINLISSNDITHFVNIGHPVKKLLSDGEIKMKSIRDLNTMKAEVDIDLKDFVLINSSASLKILSLPSISGLVSIAEGEEGIRFGYGQISYTESDKKFSNIDAFAVSDSIGLVMEGEINRKESMVDMSGEISPMHLVNALIQKVPLIGPIIIGDEGEGLFSIDFSLKGDVDDPEVSSNPLTIIKPRIIERALETLNSNQVIQ